MTAPERGLFARGFLALVACAVMPGAAVAAPEPVPAGADVLVDTWEPGVVPGLDVLGVSSSAVPPHLRPVAGFHFGVVGSPLVVSTQGAGGVSDGPVSQRLRLDLTVGLGLFERLAVALQLPLILGQSGEVPAAFAGGGELPGGGLGDLRLGLRGLVYSGGGFGLAFGLDVHAPTGVADGWVSAGGFRLAPSLIADWYAPSGLGIAVNLGWRVAPEQRAYNLVADDALLWAVGLVLPTPAPRLDARVSLAGQVSIADAVDPNVVERALEPDDPIELVFALGLGLGPRLAADRAILWPVRVELGGGAGLTRGVGAPEWRAFLGVTWSPASSGARDSDGDGLEDGVDPCPEQAEDRDGFQDEDGCPEPDNDGDGVPDAQDGGADASGFGRCRDLAEDKDGFQDEDGCPEPDNDSDGVPDVGDACPDQAEDKDGFQDDDGCPDFDNDGDGIQDAADGAFDGTGFGRCRDQAETVNGYRDGDGCPDVEPRFIKVEMTRLALAEKVFFEPNRSQVKAQSEPLLIELAQVLLDHPELTKVLVEVHTDVLGDPGHNDRLSQARASVIVDFLVARGVARGRLDGQGLGSRRPIVEGPAGRVEPGLSLNRRVEVHIIERAVPR